MRRLVACAVLLVLLAGCAAPADNGWATAATGIDEARAAGLSGQGVRVAVLDTGIDAGHASLRHLRDGRPGNGELVAFVDFLGGSGGPHDRGGHGTFVAGLLAARPPRGAVASVADAGSAVQGLAPGVELLVGRVCDRGECSLGAIHQGLAWALQQDADIVSLSLGYAHGDLEGLDATVDRIHRDLQELEARGVLVVAAAGNTRGPVLFPAREPTVLAVGAVDRDGQARARSARGLGSAKPDLMAPGDDIVGPAEGGGRVRYDGTSAAVPFVVAAAAFLVEHGPDPEDAAGVAALRQALREAARPLPGQAVPHDPVAGHGLLQAGTALRLYALAPPEAGPPRPQWP